MLLSKIIMNANDFGYGGAMNTRFVVVLSGALFNPSPSWCICQVLKRSGNVTEHGK